MLTQIEPGGRKRENIGGDFCLSLFIIMNKITNNNNNNNNSLHLKHLASEDLKVLHKLQA